MDVFHRSADTAPPALDYNDIKPTLIISWWCTAYATTIILFRVTGRYLRVEKLLLEDSIMLASILLLFARMGLAHGVLLHGTNNVALNGLSAIDVSAREYGSKLVLGARLLYTLYIWTIKLSVAFFLKRLTSQFFLTSSATSNKQTPRRRFQRLVTPMLYMFLAMTLLGAIISIISECQPFSHYWQVSPDPGSQCRDAYAQLLTFSTLSILTDITLILFPLPMLFRARLSTKPKLSLLASLSLPLICIAYTLFRVISIYQHSSSQQYRTLTASLDMLIKTIIANALVVMTFLQDKGLKKQKFKYSPETIQSYGGRPMRNVALMKRWGSDEDLMRDDDDCDGRIGSGSVSPGSAGDLDGVKSHELKDIERPEKVSLGAKRSFGDIIVRTTWDVESQRKS